jgi:hypothetical protein
MGCRVDTVRFLDTGSYLQRVSPFEMVALLDLALQ